MAVKRLKQNQAYSLTQPLGNIFPAPIVATRAPTVDDTVEIGQTWIDTSQNAAYVLSSISAGSATWISLDTSASETPANLTVANAVTFSAANKLNGVLLTNGSGVVTGSNAATGYVLAGAGVGSTPSFAQLTSADGTVLFDSTVPGSIDVTIPGSGHDWSVVSADVNPMVVNQGYIVDDVTAGARVNLTLPASSVVGSVIKIVLLGTTFGWRIAQGANQQMRLGNTWSSSRTSTAGAGGYIDCINLSTSAVAPYASIEMVCVTADLYWNILSFTGELNFV